MPLRGHKSGSNKINQLRLMLFKICVGWAKARSAVPITGVGTAAFDGHASLCPSYDSIQHALEFSTKSLVLAVSGENVGGRDDHGKS
jgi:hypothetical protein